MSERLDPRVLFELIAAHVPGDLHPNILIAGSLAAAYHHRDRLTGGGINTKDADVMVQPAGAIRECEAIATRLLGDGWRRAKKCYAMQTPEPVDDLRAIRLHPPPSDAYFLELLSFPDEAQREERVWAPCRLDDGWYGLPCFRYLGLAAHDRQRSEVGLEYAAPSMMALANLLSHPTLERAGRMSEPIAGRTLLRSAKDLGRVLALAWLTDTRELAGWAEAWKRALTARFPQEWQRLAIRAGDGLRALLADGEALEQARHSVEVGLLSGHGMDGEKLTAVGEQVLELAVAPLTR